MVGVKNPMSMWQVHEKKLIYFTLGVAGLFLIVGATIIYPQYRGIEKINQEILAVHKTLEQKFETTKQMHKSQINLIAAKKIGAELQLLFVKKGEEIKLVTALERLAEQLCLEQNLSLSSTANKVSEHLSDFDLQITVVGNFQNLMKYLEALEKNDYLFAITGVSLNSKNGPASLLLSLKAKIYVQN